jgi:hypothetical protein
MSLASPYNSYLVDYNPGTPPATPLTSLPYSPHPQTPFQVTEYTSEGLFSSTGIHIETYAYRDGNHKEYKSIG